MKLYATTTSERASKGQGGEYLDIRLSGENKQNLGIITVRYNSHKGYIINYANPLGMWNIALIKDNEFPTLKEEQKGKSQKGEKCAFDGCDNEAEQYYKKEKYCDGHYTMIHSTI